MIPAAFVCGADGVWLCQAPFVFQSPGDFLYCAPGTRYKPGTSYNGFDVGGLLDRWRLTGVAPDGYDLAHPHSFLQPPGPN